MKIKFLALLVTILAVLITFFSFVQSLIFTSTSTPSSTNTSTSNQLFNFTVKNENSTANITQVNITLPTGFGFISASNATNATSSFNFDSTALNLTWNNETGLINVSSSAWFSFNVSVPFIFRTVNFNVTALDNSSIVNTTNISIAVAPEAVSMGREFGLMPKTIYLNWTNSYQTNFSVLSNSTISIMIEFFDNTSALTANYSQESPSLIYLKIKNNTEDFNKINNLSTFSNVNYTIYTYCWLGGFDKCKPGRYQGLYRVRNTTNVAENATITIVFDSPVNISSANGTGSFSGILPKFANESQSLYFTRSSVPNATSIIVNVTFNSGDLDIFLLTNDTTPKLLAKSINKTRLNEELSYNFIKDNNITYEIRIYGNTSDASGISYNGVIILMSLNSTQHQEIDYNIQNVTNNIIQNVLNLTNEGDIPLTNVAEDKQFYYVKRFYGSSSNNFSIFIPDSSIVTGITVRLNWTSDGAYNISLFNQSNFLMINSSNKFINANISNVEREEFLETSPSTQSGTWRIEVKSTTSTLPEYNITFQAFVNASKWITTNFSSYTNKTFDIIGTQNATKYVQINFSTPNTTAINGLYEGFLIYRGNNRAQIKISLKVNITTPTLVVNDTMNTKEVIVQENYNATLTRSIYFNISNYGNYNLSTLFLNSANLSCSVNSPTSCTGYNASFVYNNTSEIPSNSFSLIQVNVLFNYSMPKNTLYEGWLFINSTHSTDSNLTSHPYSSFNISIKLNLTDRWNITITDLKSGDWGNETINVLSKASWVNVTFNLKYVNGTNVTQNTLFDYRNITNVWLFEPNGSYYVNSTKNLDFVRLGASDTGTISPSISDWGINFTVPANVPGGRYYIRINLTSMNLTPSGSSYVYRGESLDDSTKQLVVYNTGLYMTELNSTSISLGNVSIYMFAVNVSNYGPVAASSASIRFSESCSGWSVDNGAVSETSCGGLTSDNTNKNFTINTPAYNTSCLVWWTITAGSSAASVCTGNIIGSPTSKWFNPNGINVNVSVTAPTTTTTSPSDSSLLNITPTTTTLRTTTTTLVTTPPPVNETVNVSLITPAVPAIFNISNPETLKIQKIIVAVKNNVSNVTINVKESSKPSAAPNVTKPDEGVVLKYLEISQTNLADANISSVFINFQVEKSWVTANNIDVGTIALYRYVNSTWVKLQTKKINETSTYLYFQSISPGLSIFAIAGQKAKGLPWLLIFVIGGAIAVAVLAYLFWPVEEKKLSPVAHAPEKIEKKDEIKETWDVLKKKWDELTEKKEKT